MIRQVMQGTDDEQGEQLYNAASLFYSGIEFTLEDSLI